MLLQYKKQNLEHNNHENLQINRFRLIKFINYINNYNL